MSWPTVARSSLKCVPWFNAWPLRLKLKDRTGAIKRYRAARPRWACLGFSLSVMGGSQERPLADPEGDISFNGETCILSHLP